MAKDVVNSKKEDLDAAAQKYRRLSAKGVRGEELYAAHTNWLLKRVDYLVESCRLERKLRESALSELAKLQRTRSIRRAS